MSTPDKIHVLFISSWFPSETEPFNGNFVLRHAEAVAEYANVSFLNVTTDSLNDKSALNISKKIKLYEKKIQFGRWHLKPIILIQKLFFHWKLFKQISKENGQPNIIHANVIYPSALFAWFLKMLTGIPFIVSEHWTGYLPEKKPKLSSFKQRIHSLLVRKAFLICPVSDYLAKSMLTNNINGDYLVVPNVINTNIFYKKLIKSTDSKLKLVHISSLIEEHKNITGLINSMQLLVQKNVDFELHIITCNRSHEWETYLKEREINRYITFHYGFTPQQIASFLSDCDALLLFSNFETFGVVIIEAFAAGIPVVSSNTGPAKELISPDRGIITPIGDEEQFANAIFNLSNKKNDFNSGKLQDFAFQNFSYRAVGKKFLEIYKTSISNKK